MTEEYTESASEPTVEAWGERLTAARESIALTRDQVASELNLPPEYIDILEQGGLDGLPSVVFAKGYIRSYAKLLHLDSDELIAEYEQLHGVVSSRGQIRPVGKEHQQVKMSHPLMKLTSWLIVFAILGVSVWWWQTQYGSDVALPAFHDEPQSEAEDASPVVTMENGTAQLVLPKLDDKPEGETVAAAEVSEFQTDVEDNTEASSDSEPEYLSEEQIKKLQQNLEAGQTESLSVADEPVAIEVPKETVGLNVAAISADFVSECWVSIKDADGKTLFNNLRGKGQSVSVSGTPPLNVLIGAADAVGRFSFNGEELNITQYSRKNIVRINLPIEE
ncbi:MAG: helix-turn-helix domain-containing protein [Neptuniibacter sp.]